MTYNGLIVQVIISQCLSEGHDVFGLIRDTNKVDALHKMGITPVLGTLENNEILTQYAESCEAVINAANSDHRNSIDAFISALRGTGKTFIHTSGSSVIGDDALGEYESDQIYSDEEV